MSIATITHQKTNAFINWFKQQQYPVTLNNTNLAHQINNQNHSLNKPLFEVSYTNKGWKRCRSLETTIARLKKQKALVQTGRGNSRKLYPTIDLDKYNSKTFDANSLLGLKGYNPNRKDIHQTIVRFVDVHLVNSNVNREMRYRQAYRFIYAQFALKTGIDLYEEIDKHQKKTGKKLLKLDIVENLNVTDVLFMIALDCLFNYKGF